MKRRARIAGTGMYVPNRVVDNDELAQRIPLRASETRGVQAQRS